MGKSGGPLGRQSVKRCVQNTIVIDHGGHLRAQRIKISYILRGLSALGGFILTRQMYHIL